MTVTGWCDAFGSGYQTVSFTEERKKALIERIRKRKYNFNYTDHTMLPYCAPFYNDGVICVLTKAQFDGIMKEAWYDMPRGSRRLPMDAITLPVKDGVLYEKEKFMNKEN